MSWKDLTTLSQLDEIVSESNSAGTKGVLIFKHSTRCSVSFFAKKMFDKKWTFPENCPSYYLDLISHRDISNEIATRFDVEHQSPQILLIKNGKCVYSATHNQIDAGDLLNQISE